MALTNCRECGTQVSTSAKTCPSCGIARPGEPKWVPWASGGLFVLIALSMFSCMNTTSDNSSPPRERQQVAERPTRTPSATIGTQIDAVINGRGSDWVRAGAPLRAATAREIAARLASSRGWGDTEQINASAFLVGCLNSATEGGPSNVATEMAVIELAATCMVMRDNGGL